MTLSDWKAKGQCFTYKQKSIFYVDEGLGYPLVLLHGFPTSSWDWYRLWPELIKQHRTLAFDLIGFGYSDKPTNYKYSLIDQADLTESIMSELGIKGAHIMAHDYGDSVAQELLARNNEGKLGFKIKSCTLLNGGLFPGVHKPRLIQKLLMTPLGSLLAKLYSKKQLSKTFNRIFGPETAPSRLEIDDFWELISFNEGKAVAHKLIMYMAERVTYKQRWLKSLQESICPLKLIDGAADPISGVHMAEHYRTVIPEPNITLIEKIGHYPQIESPQKVLESLDEFINAT
ncbi:MAG: alpha/beta hydrolase [Cyclobacteriaceae bacterium]